VKPSLVPVLLPLDQPTLSFAVTVRALTMTLTVGPRLSVNDTAIAARLSSSPGAPGPPAPRLTFGDLAAAARVTSTITAPPRLVFNKITVQEST